MKIAEFYRRRQFWRRHEVGSGNFYRADAAGYACTSEQVTDVLLAVSGQKETIEQVCADLQIKVGAETMRGYFHEQLKVEKLSEW